MLHRSGHIYFNREFDGFGIGCGQVSVLGMLYNDEGVSQEDLAGRLGLDKATAARHVMKLMKKGYVTRVRSKEDARKWELYLTENALHIKDDFFRIRRRWTEILSEGFDANDLDFCFSSLERMAENAQRELKRRAD